MRFRLFVALVASMLIGGLVGGGEVVGASGHLQVSVARASVAPDGTTAGAPTDFVVTFRHIEPSVPGIGLKAGGTVRIDLPPGFVNNGPPVLASGSNPECAPPLVEGCSTAVLLQGWTQSPVLPFPDVTWDESTNTIVLTATADWMPAGPSSPGPKQVHLILLGFTNPERPGSYPIGVSIQPDPNDPATLEGVGNVRILGRSQPSINPNSLANGGPPPPFPNTLFQEIAAGDDSLTMAFFLWDENGDPIEGADFVMHDLRNGDVVDGSGKKIGHVRVNSPFGSDEHRLVTGGPAPVVPAFVTGVPTARLTAVLETDADVAGWHRVTIRMFGGNTLRHRIITS